MEDPRGPKASTATPGSNKTGPGYSIVAGSKNHAWEVRGIMRARPTGAAARHFGADMELGQSCQWHYTLTEMVSKEHFRMEMLDETRTEGNANS